MSIWNDLGFRASPYNTDPIPPDDEGIQLLVGREKELRRLRLSLTSSQNHATIEGANGVGKTSLVGVASFKLFKEFQLDTTKPMFIPVRRPFQISASESAAEFSDKFLLSLAREILARRSILPTHRSPLQHLNDLERLLNDPVMTGGGGGATVFGVGAQATVTQSANTSQAFAKGGVEHHLRLILETVFPDNVSGGFVCVLDNLELLDTSAKARATLEELRDGILSFPGVKWVLCGARGIIRSAASTPRLQGKLNEPMELLPLGPMDVTQAIRTRLELFKARPDAYTPVDADGFNRIYRIVNHNLRIALKFCEDFVFWCEDTSNKPETSEEKLLLIDAWFAVQASIAQESTTDLTPRAWEVFDGIASKPEGCSPGEYEDFGFNSSQALQPYLRALELATLIESSTADTDRRRKTINLTPRGWTVRYNRNGYKLPPDNG